MPVPRIKVAFGVTLNCGNYESVRIDIGMEQDLEPGQLPQDVMNDCWKLVTKKVAAKAKIEKGKLIGSDTEN
jgi:hypothetical protein